MHFYKVLLVCLIGFMSVQAFSNVQSDNDMANALFDKRRPDENNHDHRRSKPTHTIKKAKCTKTTPTPSPTCVASGGPCDLDNPGACCSLTCTNFNPPAHPICA